jgi:hypothetical protein
MAYPLSLMFRRGSPLVEQFNQIITERMPFLWPYLDRPAFREECRDHLFPLEMDVSATFSSLGGHFESDK